MKELLFFSFRLFALKILVEILSALMLFIILLSIQNPILRVIVSLISIFVFMMLLWDYSSRQGTKDAIVSDSIKKTREQGGKLTRKDYANEFKPWKGFLASAIASFPALILTIITTILILLHKGGETIHFILVATNTIYVPVFHLFPMGNMFLDLNIIPGADTIHSMLNYKVPVIPYMFFFPQLLFIIWGGISYNLGRIYRQNLKPTTKKKNRLF